MTKELTLFLLNSHIIVCKKYVFPCPDFPVTSICLLDSCGLPYSQYIFLFPVSLLPRYIRVLADNLPVSELFFMEEFTIKLSTLSIFFGLSFFILLKVEILSSLEVCILPFLFEVLSTVFLPFFTTLSLTSYLFSLIFLFCIFCTFSFLSGFTYISLCFTVLSFAILCFSSTI